MVVELVERPLPRPTDAAYVEARLLEALGEAGLALEYLERALPETPRVRPSRLGRRLWRPCCGLSWIS
jgi:hypothetical protein